MAIPPGLSGFEPPEVGPVAGLALASEVKIGGPVHWFDILHDDAGRGVRSLIERRDDVESCDQMEEVGERVGLISSSSVLCKRLSSVTTRRLGERS
jgi:hypothetical protein